ncbi:MAG: FlgB family protein [Paracoccaceae bacterium]
MLKDLTIFQLAGNAATHAGRRQALLTQNVANADTPGYRALDLPDFAEAVSLETRGAAMQATRPTHLQGTSSQINRIEPFERPGEADPNGNTVALDRELMFAVDAKRTHDRSLAVYRSALDILRTAIRVR